MGFHQTLVKLDKFFYAPYVVLKLFFDRFGSATPLTNWSGDIIIIKLFGMGSIVRIADELRERRIDIDQCLLITSTRNEEISKYLGFKTKLIQGDSVFQLAYHTVRLVISLHKLKGSLVLDFERMSNAVGLFRLFLSTNKRAVSYESATNHVKHLGSNTYVSDLAHEHFSLLEVVASREPSIETQVNRRVNGVPVIYVNVNASDYITERKLPLSKFEKLIRELHQLKPTAKFVLIGSKNEREYVSALHDTLTEHSIDIENRSGDWNIQEFADRLSQADLLITNDSGPMHLANYLKVPTVVFWGPTIAKKSGYEDSSRMMNISHELSCRPCFKGPKSKIAIACNRRVDCLNHLDEKKIAESIHEFLPSGMKQDS